MPTAGLSAASAMPRAAAMPTRKPVKLPGPVVTATRSISGNVMPAWSMTRCEQRHQRFGMAAHHRQAFAGDDAALFGVEHGRRAGRQRRINGEYAHGRSAANGRLESPDLHRPDFGDVGNEMTQQILDAVPQRRRR